MLFFDTSALVKRYAEEPGTDIVDELLEKADTPVLITSLTVIETTSAFRRKQNAGELSERRRDDLLVAFFREATGSFTLIPVLDEGFQMAVELVLQDDLRTLDALQLGTALALTDLGSDLRFVGADENLLEVAADRGLPTINPTAEHA
ncbi:MAG: type II toxin-antitoxin system VapC family toxin [Halobacteriales archaeon]|nr:type II toxin-antitoxin system VapC family toxin [Halobacteriales archaeon]